jgi:hypothetical protein
MRRANHHMINHRYNHRKVCDAHRAQLPAVQRNCPGGNLALVWGRPHVGPATHWDCETYEANPVFWILWVYPVLLISSSGNRPPARE